MVRVIIGAIISTIVYPIALLLHVTITRPHQALYNLFHDRHNQRRAIKDLLSDNQQEVELLGDCRPNYEGVGSDICEQLYHTSLFPLIRHSLGSLLMKIGCRLRSGY